MLYCVDPGTEADPVTFYSGCKHVVSVSANIQVCFPFVNSCIALIFVLPGSGELVCGHVAMQEADPSAPLDPLGNLHRVAGRMLFQAGVAMPDVTRVIAIGGYPWEDFYGQSTPFPSWKNQATVKGNINRIIVNRWDAINVYTIPDGKENGKIRIFKAEKGKDGGPINGGSPEVFTYTQLKDSQTI